MEIEQVFSSKPRLKILKLIYTLGQLNVSDIGRRININYTSTTGHIKILESEGILELRTYGRVRMYRFSGSKKAQAVAGLIEAWENQSQ
ncbi:MAG: helix-turn-helix domain-containing protein [Nitrososphaerota archaeon]|jgi:DNA-binding transcriptional ArsR family regulator|uniref:helix-turn-helix domain-containing protein n=1 Tax=Candidatus Bathycorpusculum sp. TaxID=2994959 RepID=UPI0028395E15|nr:helix-turn-helix domain-containing protein [Candidatus Termitimicrobium sp.]MCL2430953.1 helix-turn-helix domain-containing protein [Candidatus Termitimicrobium sp.]MDR0493661.1 helix-turn-helix domain-containing protein [Nitrososphaerota archaeon]